MNPLSSLFTQISDGDTVCLEAGSIYHVRQDDAFTLKGYYCSNTATPSENLLGARHAAIYLKDRKNITIDGRGAAIIIHGKMTPFVFDACEHITVKNLTVDYAAPTMTEFRVLSVDRRVCVVRFNSGSLFRVEGNILYFCGENDLDGKPYWEYESNGPLRFTTLFDPDTETTVGYDNRHFVFDAIEQLDSRTLRLTFRGSDHGLVVGRVIQSRNIVRDQTGAMAQRCKDLTYETCVSSLCTVWVWCLSSARMLFSKTVILLRVKEGPWQAPPISFNFRGAEAT